MMRGLIKGAASAVVAIVAYRYAQDLDFVKKQSGAIGSALPYAIGGVAGSVAGMVLNRVL